MKQIKQRRDIDHELARAVRKIKRLQKENQKLTEKLYTDELTGIANRRTFEEKFSEIVAVAHNSQEPLALLLADIDGLKRTNDQLGHKKGDELLKAVGKALKIASRDTDLTGRLGGDEYFVILPGFYPLDGQALASLVAETTARYRSCFDDSVQELKLPKRLRVSVSFGLALLGPKESADELYQRTDKILQSNKKKMYKRLSEEGATFKDPRL